MPDEMGYEQFRLTSKVPGHDDDKNCTVLSTMHGCLNGTRSCSTVIHIHHMHMNVKHMEVMQ